MGALSAHTITNKNHLYVQLYLSPDIGLSDDKYIFT